MVLVVLDKLFPNSTNRLSPLMAIFVILSSFGLYFIDFTSLWNGYPLETLVIGWKILFYVALLFFIIFFVVNRYALNKLNLGLSGKFLLYTLWGFIIVGGLAIDNIISIVHVLFSIIVFFTFG